MFRRSKTTSSTDDVYVSDEKIEKLAAELRPRLRERLGLTLSASYPSMPDLPQVSTQVQLQPRIQGRGARARRLCDAFDKETGRIWDEETRFFRGELTMVWGFFNRADDRYADVAYFSGFADEATYVGLGGSAYHTQERESARLQKHSNSGTQAIMRFLYERSKTTRADVPKSWDDWYWESELWEADHDSPSTPESFEFVAQRLLDRPGRHGIRFVIGSPIYVARAGPTTRRVIRDYEALRDRHALRINKKPRRQIGSSGRWQIARDTRPQLPPASEPLEEDDL